MVNVPYFIDIYQGDNVMLETTMKALPWSRRPTMALPFLTTRQVKVLTKRTVCVPSVVSIGWMTSQIRVKDVDGTVLMLQPRFSFYHFNGTASPTVEAANFIKRVKNAGFAPGDDLCLDWEDVGSSGHQNSAAWADDFCKYVEDWCGFWIKYYGGDAPRKQLLKASTGIIANFANRRSWGCQYGNYVAAERPIVSPACRGLRILAG